MKRISQDVNVIIFLQTYSNLIQIYSILLRFTDENTVSFHDIYESFVGGLGTDHQCSRLSLPLYDFSAGKSARCQEHRSRH